MLAICRVYQRQVMNRSKIFLSALDLLSLTTEGTQEFGNFDSPWFSRISALDLWSLTSERSSSGKFG